MKPAKVIGFLILTTAVWNCGIAQLSSEKKQQIDNLFSEWNRENSPGCALGLIQNGKLIYTKGYGMASLENRVPINSNSVFYCGSVSKMFVTFCILLLQEEGLLAVDDPIKKYLPDFPDYGYPIRIRNLIHHTSGIRDNLTLWSLMGNSVLDYCDKDEMLDLIYRQKELNFVPGTRYLYSNACYLLLAEIIHKVSGQTLREYAETHIFNPLDMASTHFHDHVNHIINNRAWGYVKNGDTFETMLMRYDLVGSGGMYSCIEDLYKWDQNFYHNRLGKRNQELITKMTTDGKLNDGRSAGYAYALVNGELSGKKTISHGGALAGYRAHFLQFPDDRTSIILLSNLANFQPGNLAEQVARILLDLPISANSNPIDQYPYDPEEIKADDADWKIPSSGEGKYFSEELQTYYHFYNETNQWKIKVKRIEIGCNQEVEFQLDCEGMKVKFAPDYSKFTIDAGRVKNLTFIKSKYD